MAPETTQQKLIRAATKRALESRDPYSEKIAADLTESLKQARSAAVNAVMNAKLSGSKPSMNGMTGLQRELDRILGRLERSNTVAFQGGMRGSFNLGIANGIGDLVDAGLPGYRDLSPTGINRLATKAFTLVDTDALDFMSEYTLVLAGDVQQELASGLRRAILTGISTGKSAEDIVRDMGGLVDDPEAFRRAGGRVFPTAKNRLQAIARTEVLRAHNQGSVKFLQRVGVQKVDWLAMEDERMCPVCGALDGRAFAIDKLPPQPAHTHCRCTHIPQIPDNILLPEDLEAQHAAQAQEVKRLDKAFDSGSVTDLSGLTYRQLTLLSQKHGIGLSHSRDDYLRLLQVADPAGFRADLGAEELRQAVKKNGIGPRRTADELAKLLAQKQVAIRLEQLQRSVEQGGPRLALKPTTKSKAPAFMTPADPDGASLFRKQSRQKNISAANKEQANKRSGEIVRAGKGSDYFIDRRHKPIFSKTHFGIEAEDLMRLIGTASPYPESFPVGLCNEINTTLTELQEECARLGIPKIRAMCFIVPKEASMTMGDGILAISEADTLFNYTKPATVVANTVSQLLIEKPRTVREYFSGVGRVRGGLYHEFAHHIQQFYKATPEQSITKKGGTPFERQIHKAWTASGKGVTSASKYASNEEYGFSEWWAENYALARMGHLSLVDSNKELRTLLNKVLSFRQDLL